MPGAALRSSSQPEHGHDRADRAGTLPNIGKAGAGAETTLAKGSKLLSASSPNLGHSLASRVDISGGGSPWWDDFVQRQFEHSTTDFRRGMSLLQRDVNQHGRAVDDVEFWGGQGLVGFRKYLKNRYGSIVAAWRVLDRDRSGRLSWGEFCLACRHMGYHGNLKQLWKEMDQNDSGSVSIMELDPETGRYVGTFKMALLRKYGDMLTAWKKGIDRNGNGHIDEAEINECVSELGLDLNSKKLFNMLRSGPKELGLSLDQFDPDAYKRQYLGDVKGLTAMSNHEFLEDMEAMGHKAELSVPMDVMAKPLKDGARKWRQYLHELDRAARNKWLAKIKKYSLGIHTVKTFKEALIVRYASLYGAWKNALDLDGNGRLTFGEFVYAMNKLGFHGNLRSLWCELDEEAKGYVGFEDLDPLTDLELTELREKFTKKYGNLLVAWLRGIDVLGNGFVSEDRFVKACDNVGYQGDAHALFRLMQPDVSRKTITLEDFDTKAYLAYHRGDFTMMTEEGDERKPPKKKMKTEESFYERQATTFTNKLERAWAQTHRSEFAKACRIAGAQDHVIDTPEEFEQLCRRKYGTVMAAWRQCLDSDQNGRLTMGEFAQALRKLGYAGDFGKLWQHYTRGAKGHIFLHDICPEEEELVSSFIHLLAEKYVTIDNAWKAGFKKAFLETADLKELQRACEAIGYPHDAKKLFNCLRTTPGQQQLTVWDIDPLCTKKRQRGQVGYLSVARPPGSPKNAGSGHGSTLRKSASQTTLLSASQSSPTAATPPCRAASASKLAPLTGQSRGENPIFGGLTSLQALRLTLKNKYGSTVAAWRTLLDPEMTGFVSFGTFCLVLSQGLFNGNAKVVFQELCAGRSSFGFADLDPSASKNLAQLREKLLKNFRSIQEAWHAAFDVAGKGQLKEEVFIAACEKHLAARADSKWAKKLFKMMLPRPETKLLQLEDFECLVIGLSVEERVEAWVGSDKSNEDDAATEADAVKLKAQEAIEAALEMQDGTEREAEAIRKKAQEAIEAALDQRDDVEEAEEGEQPDRDAEIVRLQAQAAMEAAMGLEETDPERDAQLTKLKAQRALEEAIFKSQSADDEALAEDDEPRDLDRDDHLTKLQAQRSLEFALGIEDDDPERDEEIARLKAQQALEEAMKAEDQEPFAADRDEELRKLETQKVLEAALGLEDDDPGRNEETAKLKAQRALEDALSDEEEEPHTTDREEQIRRLEAQKTLEAAMGLEDEDPWRDEELAKLKAQQALEDAMDAEDAEAAVAARQIAEEEEEPMSSVVSLLADSEQEDLDKFIEMIKLEAQKLSEPRGTMEEGTDIVDNRDITTASLTVEEDSDEVTSRKRLLLKEIEELKMERDEARRKGDLAREAGDAEAAQRFDEEAMQFDLAVFAAREDYEGIDALETTWRMRRSESAGYDATRKEVFDLLVKASSSGELHEVLARVRRPDGQDGTEEEATAAASPRSPQALLLPTLARASASGELAAALAAVLEKPSSAASRARPPEDNQQARGGTQALLASLANASASGHLVAALSQALEPKLAGESGSPSTAERRAAMSPVSSLARASASGELAAALSRGSSRGTGPRVDAAASARKQEPEAHSPLHTLARASASGELAAALAPQSAPPATSQPEAASSAPKQQPEASSPLHRLARASASGELAAALSREVDAPTGPQEEAVSSAPERQAEAMSSLHSLARASASGELAAALSRDTDLPPAAPQAEDEASAHEGEPGAAEAPSPLQSLARASASGELVAALSRDTDPPPAAPQAEALSPLQSLARASASGELAAALSRDADLPPAAPQAEADSPLKTLARASASGQLAEALSRERDPPQVASDAKAVPSASEEEPEATSPLHKLAQASASGELAAALSRESDRPPAVAETGAVSSAPAPEQETPSPRTSLARASASGELAAALSRGSGPPAAPSEEAPSPRTSLARASASGELAAALSGGSVPPAAPQEEAPSPRTSLARASASGELAAALSGGSVPPAAPQEEAPSPRTSLARASASGELAAALSGGSVPPAAPQEEASDPVQELARASANGELAAALSRDSGA